MEERRSGLRRLLLAGLALAFPAWGCEPGLEGTRIESARFVLAYRAHPQVGSFFSIDVAACAKGGPPPKSLKVDAHMPAHRHGMNYAPKVTPLGPGRWRAEGLMLHMPGKWEFVFVLDGDRLAHGNEVSFFNEIETKKILSHGPWPPPARRDPSNRVSGRPEAIALGERLFFDPRLSGSGSVLCASCHVPFRAFQDGRPRGFGLEEGDRNTPSLFNVAFYRWYGWDGGHDSLWSQSIRPLLDAREMKASAAHVAATVRRYYANAYRLAFQREIPSKDEAVLVDAGKALAAFQETLVSGRTPFDDFRDALEAKDEVAMRRYPEAAKRGLRTFVGKGSCSVCHVGPLFTNGEFGDVGVPFFTGPGKVDAGRQGGIKKLESSRFNLLGRFNDDAERSSATGTRHVVAQHRNFGEFRVPGLRNVARTAPYMHNGSLATLQDVVKHYSELNEERLHADGEKILRRLDLAPQEVDDLVVFLETLSPAGDK